MVYPNTLGARWIVISVMGIMGAAFFYVFLSDDLQNSGASAAPLASRYLIAMAVGGGLAGAVFARLFGQPGVQGWIWAAIGAVFCSLVAGLIGSFLGVVPDLIRDGLSSQNLVSIGFGLVLIPLAMVGRPIMFVVWLGLAAVAHLLAARAR